jgi:hypothetical protein
MPILHIYIIYQCKDSNIILLVKPEAMPKYGATVVHPAITSFNTGDAPAMWIPIYALTHDWSGGVKPTLNQRPLPFEVFLAFNAGNKVVEEAQCHVGIIIACCYRVRAAGKPHVRYSSGTSAMELQACELIVLTLNRKGGTSAGDPSDAAMEGVCIREEKTVAGILELQGGCTGRTEKTCRCRRPWCRCRSHCLWFACGEGSTGCG